MTTDKIHVIWRSKLSTHFLPNQMQLLPLIVFHPSVDLHLLLAAAISHQRMHTFIDLRPAADEPITEAGT
jgi:hypothetical protein